MLNTESDMMLNTEADRMLVTEVDRMLNTEADKMFDTDADRILVSPYYYEEYTKGSLYVAIQEAFQKWPHRLAMVGYYTHRHIDLYRMFFADCSVNSQPNTVTFSFSSPELHYMLYGLTFEQYNIF